MGKRSERPYLVAHVSDIHAGSSVALCPDKIALDDGGEYHASKAQRWLWSCWLDYWQCVDAKQKALNARLVTVFNGDLVDGQVKHSTQILSGNPNAQAAVVNAAMRVALDLEPDHIVVVRGTEAHVGQSASSEERIADGLRRDKRPIVSDPETKTASHWHFRMNLGGVVFDITHHGRTGQREHTRGSAAVLHAHDIILAHVKHGERPPDLCLRGHHHKFNDSGRSAKLTRVCTSGAWQLATGYVKKVAADSLADVGGHLVTVQDGKYDVEEIAYTPERSPIWTP